MNAKQQKLLDSVLSFVVRHGWTERAIEEAGADARKTFPDIESLVEAFHQSINDQMSAAFKSYRRFPALRTREKVAFAVKARLKILDGKEDLLRRLLLWSLMPKHVAVATKYLWSTSDLIWKAAGDKSTDYNYYTKRLLLCGVMKLTVSFWLNDSSKNHQETWAFLDRRIDNVMTLGKGIGAVKAVGLGDIISLVRKRFAA